MYNDCLMRVQILLSYPMPNQTLRKQWSSPRHTCIAYTCWCHMLLKRSEIKIIPLHYHFIRIRAGLNGHHVKLKLTCCFPRGGLSSFSGTVWCNTTVTVHRSRLLACRTCLQWPLDVNGAIGKGKFMVPQTNSWMTFTGMLLDEWKIQHICCNTSRNIEK